MIHISICLYQLVGVTTARIAALPFSFVDSLPPSSRAEALPIIARLQLEVPVLRTTSCPTSPLILSIPYSYIGEILTFLPA